MENYTNKWKHTNEQHNWAMTNSEAMIIFFKMADWEMKNATSVHEQYKIFTKKHEDEVAKHIPKISHKKFNMENSRMLT